MLLYNDKDIIASLNSNHFREAYHFIESGEMEITKPDVGSLLLNFPFMLPYAGYVDNDSGNNANHNVSGYGWTNRIFVSTHANYLYFTIH